MINTRENASNDTLHKRTSDRMAELLWKQYKHKFPGMFQDCDYIFRLRVAHTLLLRFFHVYFNRTHKHPTYASQEWIIKQVLNDDNSSVWPIVG